MQLNVYTAIMHPRMDNIQKGVGIPTTWSCPKKLRLQRIFFRATQTYSTLFGVTLKWTPWVVQLQTFSKSALARSSTDHLNFQFPSHTGTCHLLSIAIHLGARSLENFKPRKRRIPICWKDTSAGKPVWGKNWVVIQLSSPRFRVSCHQPVCVLRPWKDYLSRDMLQLRK